MEQRASEPVQAGDDQLVAGAVGRGEGLVELGPAGLGTAGMVEVDVCRVDTGAGQGIRLVVRVLVGGGDPRVSNQHVSIIPVLHGFTTLISGTCFRHGFRSVSPIGSGCRQMTVCRHAASSRSVSRLAPHHRAFSRQGIQEPDPCGKTQL